MIGAILIQQTTWKNVQKAIENIKLSGTLSPELINLISLEELENLIKPSGFYRVKARTLKTYVAFLMEGYNGRISSMNRESLEILRNKLLKIKGIGMETADSILLYALKKEIFVVDGYTKRIFERIGITNSRDHEKIRILCERSLRSEGNSIYCFNEMHALIVALGKSYCKKRPKCGICPGKDLCQKKGVKNEQRWN